MGYVSMWKNNHLRRIGWMIRLAGSIPVPKEDSSATLAMMRAVDKCLQDGNWFHIYPEASMFYYYEDVRPFVDGAFVFAVRNNKPVYPMAFSYRPPNGLYKLWKKFMRVFEIIRTTNIAKNRKRSKVARMRIVCMGGNTCSSC